MQRNNAIYLITRYGSCNPVRYALVQAGDVLSSAQKNAVTDKVTVLARSGRMNFQIRLPNEIQNCRERNQLRFEER